MTKPNLLVIHTDQQSCWTLGAYGGTLIETPTIDRIGREGAILNNFFTNSAVCTPSRGCFVTGRYPHAHGAHHNNIPLNDDEITFAQILKDNGYETSYIGKWHLDGKLRPGWVHENRSFGFDDNYYMFNRGHWKKIEDSAMEDVQATVHPYKVIGDEKTYPTDWLVEKTMDLIKRDREKPFCHMLSLPDPHGPMSVRAPYDTMFKPEDMPLPKTMNETDVPNWAKRSQERNGLKGPDKEQKLRKFLAQYCGMVKLLDDAIGRIIDLLGQMGILDDTIVVFTADHGEYAGEHGLMAKNQLYETAYRVPMMIRWPEKITANTVIDSVASTVDFQPTILSLMGVAPCGREQGRDASALLRGEEIEWADESFIHKDRFEAAGIFTDKYELVYVQGDDAILFDRQNDPDQVNNLFGDPALKEVTDELTERIVKHNIAVKSPAAKWLREQTASGE